MRRARGVYDEGRVAVMRRFEKQENESDSVEAESPHWPLLPTVKRLLHPRLNETN